jgi:hypothetical protein
VTTFFSWLADEKGQPLPIPSYLQLRETSGNNNTELKGSLLELFREYVNETGSNYGLLFKNISVSVSKVRELVCHHPDILDQIKSSEDLFRFRELNELVFDV